LLILIKVLRRYHRWFRKFSTSEESAAASEELSSQAERLKQLVEKFRLKKTSVTMDSYGELNPEIIDILGQMSKNKEKEAEIVLN